MKETVPETLSHKLKLEKTTNKQTNIHTNKIPQDCQMWCNSGSLLYILTSLDYRVRAYLKQTYTGYHKGLGMNEKAASP